MNIKNIKIPPNIFFYGVALLVILWIVYLLMKRIGLIKSQTVKKAEKETIENVKDLIASEYFNPNLYKQSNYGYAHLPSNETVNGWAKQIHDSFGWFNDDEEEIYSVFRAMNNKLTISQVSDAYTQLYSSDLLGDLKQYLNERELSFLWNIIKQKRLA